ncbi:hypothetical protein CS063_00330 [Sporanaerobium hydrogeniformans]|uniref:Uncharacterized protein n=1 Tax=Sporanaerobium hydrogeniformans TaxID=3072179 RepID=A0AC61DFZ4_9FIRM|nr:V-type ATP synthase subunit E family protein [Sporanaerobium hydrogeniformans]PHV71958.1 hypothetical protein CS063_00330 [Sporanaerobium hydrogeniformans]
MVTIEQKLTLFSKLLQQDIKEELDSKVLQLENEYKKKIENNKIKADRQAEEIVAQAIKRAEAKKIELISKGKMATKRESMLAKEKYIHTFMEHLTEKIINFTQTEAYCMYIDQCLMQCESLKNYENALIIYMTLEDLEKYQNYIAKKLEEIGLNKGMLKFKQSETAILGGFVIDDPKLNMRMDLSIRGTLEEAKNHIMEVIFKEIGEVGGTIE